MHRDPLIPDYIITHLDHGLNVLYGIKILIGLLELISFFMLSWASNIIIGKHRPRVNVSFNGY